MGPRAGLKLFTLQTLPGRPPRDEGDPNGAARANGFSLPAGVAIDPGERGKLERLCRYVSRRPAAGERLVRVVECRFFAGLSEQETAEALGTSLSMVKGDWKRAKARPQEALQDGDAG